jgi:hypothetical protein
MAKGARLQVRGLKELKKKFGSIPQSVVDEVDPVLHAHANDYANKAINDAPRDQGLLIQEIDFFKEKDLVYRVVSGAEWSAFIEWGTRSRVQIPADLASYAAQFKNKSVSGQDAKQKIYDWARRIGLPEEAWWSVFINIMTIGIHPHPFFFKHRDIVYAAIMKDLKPALTRALKK